MRTQTKLKVGAGSTVIAAFLTGLLSNGAVQTAVTDLTAKKQDRINHVIEVMPVAAGEEPLVSPAFNIGKDTTIVERIPTY